VLAAWGLAAVLVTIGATFGFGIVTPAAKQEENAASIEQLDDEFQTFLVDEGEFRGVMTNFVIRYTCWRLERSGEATESQARARCYEAPIQSVGNRVGMDP